MTMNETYTREQAMERLDIRSMRDFRRFERTYPQVFMNVNMGVHRDTQRLYDKTAVDNFANIRDKLRKVDH
jgi:hypothetical protein